MGKGETLKNIYEIEQKNRKHRGKSKKLEKREAKRKNKKKLKEARNKINRLEKYVKQKFKSSNQRFDSSKLGLDMEKMRKLLKKLKKISDTAEEEIPELIKMIETGSDIDISTLENVKVQKYLLKLLKHLQFKISSKNPYLFSRNNEFAFSQFTIVKSIFEFIKKDKESKSLCNNLEEEEIEEEDNNQEEENEELGDKYNLNTKKDELDYEFEYLEEKVGNNTKLINKAFTKILNNKIDVKDSDSEEEQFVGPPAPQFLQNTLKLIEEDDDVIKEKQEHETLDKLINRTSVKKNTKKEILKVHKEPYNKESYYKLIEEEKKRMSQLEEELEEYENTHRQSSLLEEHQLKKSRSKNNGNMDEFMMRPFEKEKDMIRGTVDSKRAVKIMRENNGLNSRFVAKEKYLGF